jgi:iron complex transport system ATP-binding protein
MKKRQSSKKAEALASASRATARVNGPGPTPDPSREGMTQAAFRPPAARDRFPSWEGSGVGSPALLQVTGLVVNRGGTAILKGIDWTVRRGEHWAILGPNGSGKTSLLSALTGYLMPTAGEMTLLGQRYGESDWRELRKRVGLVSSSIRQRMVDEEPAVETVVSGKYAMIDFWGSPKPAELRAARKLLGGLDCSYLADRPWGVLSQGERQRVLIARALMAKPDLLILDEPCAGLDPVARERFLLWLQALGQGNGRPGLVLVTHHVEEIVPALTHALLLRGGGIVAAGPVAEALTSDQLSLTFDAAVRLTRRGGRYALGFGGEFV